MKAILNNKIIGLNEVSETLVPENQRTLFNGKWYFNPDNAVIIPDAPDKPGSSYSWNGTDWELDAGKEAAEQAVIDKKQQIQTLFNSVIDEINLLYPSLNVGASDNISDVAFKMLAAGVEWADVDKYGARLKLLSEALSDLNLGR